MAIPELYIDSRRATSGDSGSESGAFHREWELIKAAPSATLNGVQERLSSFAADPGKVAELIAEGAAIGVALSHLKTHPEALWGASKHITQWAGKAGAAVLTADLGVRIGAPAVNTWNHPASLEANKIKLGQNLGAAVIEYSTMGLAGAAGYKYGSQVIEQSGKLLTGVGNIAFPNRAYTQFAMATAAGDSDALGLTSKAHGVVETNDSPLKQTSSRLEIGNSSADSVADAAKLAQRDYALTQSRDELSTMMTKAVADGRRHPNNDFYREQQRDHFFESRFNPAWEKIVAKSGKESSQLSEQKEAIAAVFREAFNSGTGKSESNTKQIVADADVFRSKLSEVWTATMAPEPENPLAVYKEQLWSTMAEALKSGRDRMDSTDWQSADVAQFTEKFGQNWKRIDALNSPSEPTRKAMRELMTEAVESGRGSFESSEDMPEAIGEFRTKFEIIWRNGFDTTP